MIKLFYFNIRMRLIDYLKKPEDIYIIGWDLVERIGKL